MDETEEKDMTGKRNRTDLDAYEPDHRVNDALDNQYVANIHACFFAVCLGVLLLTELGLYSPTVLRQMRIGTAIMLVITIAVQILGRVPSVASSDKTKYCILALTLVETLVFTSVLNFMALLVLCIPILVAMNYRSPKLAMFTAIGSAVCALLFPVIGLIFNTWAVDYFYMLIWCVTGEHGDQFPQFIRNLHPLAAALIFVGTLYFNQIVGIIYCLRSANKRQERIHKKQIEIITKSRDSMLAGMASVVENRDNNTGGHIKRTSEVVRILTGYLPLEDSFRDDIIKAAPLHDLGKIAIPDSILNKPGRLTDTEFEFIKIHPQKGYEIVCTILAGLDDERLRSVAENIALYHHEKYDGHGYPRGLKGDEIPLEARIMAIADVYDALVSVRCYKKQMSHEEACVIIRESMGTHFDPMLADCFDRSAAAIAEYYARE
ncbi:MAG: HD domain-containing protein [Oscillospiraceae bacterium]|nr:HD domain-containing protein [Oscillospiraceae bacterium]